MRESPYGAHLVTITDPCTSTWYESCGAITRLMMCSGPHMAAGPGSIVSQFAVVNVPRCAPSSVLVVVRMPSITHGMKPGANMPFSGVGSVASGHMSVLPSRCLLLHSPPQQIVSTLLIEQIGSPTGLHPLARHGHCCICHERLDGMHVVPQSGHTVGYWVLAHLSDGAGI